MNVKIYYQDDSIIVCEKPRGVISQQSDRLCMPYLLTQQTGCEILPVHRLDTDTTGVMVFALNKQSARHLSKQIENHAFSKIYVTQLESLPEKDEDTLTDLLYYDRRKNKSYVVKRMRNGVKNAELSYEVISRERNLVRVSLKTGRTHQIRVQFSSRGCPVVGDRRYGSHTDTFIHLHCESLTFTKQNGEKVTFTSQPEWI